MGMFRRILQALSRRRSSGVSRLDHLPVGVKVALAPAVAIVGLVVVGAIGLTANLWLGQALSSLGQGRVPKVIAVTGFDTRLRELHTLVNQSLAWTALGMPEGVVAQIDKRLATQLDFFGRRVEESVEQALWNEGERDALRAIGEQFRQYRGTVDAALKARPEGNSAVTPHLTLLDSAFDQLNWGLTDMVQAQEGMAADEVETSHGLIQRNLQFIGVGMGVALAIAALLAWRMSRRIVRPLRLAAQAARQVADGDLSPRDLPVSRDATGQVLGALQTMSGNLSRIVSDIRSSATEIHQASQEMASSNADLSARTESTAASLQQTAASMEQLTATLRNSAEHALEANRLAQDASRIAGEGGAAVDEVITKMQDIAQQARRIGDIIGVIDNIAFQSNILALNAAVEAARAGEAGRGFGVVAQEVRQLASRSADASREIRSLVGTSIRQVEGGTATVATAGETMKRILQSVTQVSAMMEQISLASEEQASGVAQVHEAVSAMDRTTQQNAAMVEQAAATTDLLAQQAQRLVESIRAFRTA